MRMMIVWACLVLSGCQMGYYWHLAQGHWSLVTQARPIPEVLSDPDVPELYKQRLKLTQSILAFANQQLGLESGDSYQAYVAVERNWIVWNLFATPAFSLEPRQWCYPIAGCVNYRGYFDREMARQKARALRQQGLDVYGAGAIAYSTLGWLENPLTTPMISLPPAALAELLFHELAHRWLYVPGATRFNESMATALAAEATRRWLALPDTPGSLTAWKTRQRAARRVTERVRQTRKALQALYARDLPEPVLRARKQALQQQLRAWYEQARKQHPALKAWAEWFAGPLNNAQLNTLLDYNAWVPAFNQLLKQCGGDWSCFRARIKELAEMDAHQRRQTLERLND